MSENIEKRPDKTTVLIPVFNVETIDVTFFYALPMATVFDATLTFLFMGDDFAFSIFTSEVGKKSPELIENGAVKMIHYSLSFVHMPVIEKNSEDEEAIMVIFPQMPTGKHPFVQELKFLIRAKKLRLPYMIIHRNYLNEAWQPETVIIPVGFRHTDKETAVWASYFARFNRSKIVILIANENDAVARRDTQLNVRFMLNLFAKFKIVPQLVSTKSSSGKLYDEAVAVAAQIKNSLLLITSTKHYGIEHFILGPMELRTIKNSANVPVLCVNPRKDLYVLCK
ncbi:MAG: hypothetical protein LBV41_09445 [Cytophagaceae bacterium]|nr:hypothetical protein [Cytophagaceae bacterium]